MKQDTRDRIEEYKARLPGVKERIAAVALMLVVSLVMMTSASYAWLTISRAPEVKGMNTTIAGNGNLEIALVNPEGTAPGNATGAETGLLSSNITWGNLVNLSDSGYGVDKIALRPALLSGYNRTQTPLYGASYDASGRVTSTSEKYSFATWKQAEDGSWYFDAANPTYGVRAISSVTYENITGNAQVNKLLQRAEAHYGEARTQYVNIITNETLVSTPGVYPEVYSMDALTSLIQIFVQDKASYYAAKLGGDEYVTADYSGAVTYAYRLCLLILDTLEKEGAGLVDLANMQALKAGAETTETFASIDALLDAYEAGTLETEYGVKLDSLKTYSTDYANIRTALYGNGGSIEGLEGYAQSCDPDTVTSPPKVSWTQIQDEINLLVNINNTEIAQNRNAEHLKMSQISSETLTDFLGIVQNCQSSDTPADVILGDGIWTNIEKRLPETSTDTLEGKETMVVIRLTVKVPLLITMNNTPMYAEVRTTAAEPFTANTDFAYSDAADSSTEGQDAVANDTYGMAIDMWVRTNVSDVILTLEGSLVTDMQPEYGVDKNGDSVLLYNMAHEGENTTVYQLDEIWYYADSHTEIGAVADLQDGYTFEAKQIEVVVGYDGVNRVWEDYLTHIGAGLMAENNTTQGSGSCYVFYADPSDQTRILHLLEAFTVVFVDQDGTTLGTAKLDTDHYYSINGKTTVPLKMVTGNASYTDEDGNYQLGITPLTQNEATWITALIYLDGQRLSNADVLAVGEIEGSLNIQFGSSVSLVNMDESQLRSEFRTITATATSGSQTSENSGQPITFDYDGTAKEVTVTLLVDGVQPKKISGFFVRTISQTQGTRGETVEFTSNGDNTWTATFSLSRPGKYSMRNLIVDGDYYELDDGIKEDQDENTPVVDNFPSVHINGMGINGVYCTLNPGINMTAEDSISATVTASIQAAGELMPKQVRALFRSPAGREFTALMSYNKNEDGSGGNWSGTANITESGTYTLQYLVIDGQHTELDPEMQKTYIISLGMKAQVYSIGVELEDGTFSNTFEFQGETGIPVQVKLFDGAGNEIKAMEDVWLYYHNEGSILDQDGMSGKLEWKSSTGYYEGVLELNSGGTFVFNRVVADGNDISKAALAPVFTAYVTDPPEYVSNKTESYQFVPDGGATMSVELLNAQTSSLWALIQKQDGTVYMVPCASRTIDGDNDNLYTFVFNVPAVSENQDGNWQLLAVYLQGCANDNEEWVPKTTDPVGEGVDHIVLIAQDDGTWKIDGTEKIVNPADYYIFDMAEKEPDDVIAYVVQTVNVKIEGSYSEDTGIVTFGKDGETVTGTFMDSYTTDVKFTITDWKNEPIKNIKDVAWTINHNGDQQNMGGYTGGTAGAEQKMTSSTATYSANSQMFQLAGTYPTVLSFEVNGITWSKTVITYYVWSKTPTVTVDSVTNTGSINTQIVWTETTQGIFVKGKTLEYSFSNPNGLTNSVDTESNTVWAYAAASTSGEGCGNGDAGFIRPVVTFAVAGVDSTSTVTVTIPAGDAAAISTSITGNSTDSNKPTVTLGTATTKVKEIASGYLGITYTCFGYKGHGDTVRIETVTVTRGGVRYTVYLENPIIIHNPSSVNKTS